MEDINITLTLAVTGLIALAMLAAVGLKGFMAWLELKKAELATGREATPPSATNRIELADLKERIRKLEAIAAGVDL
jgi:hypothetical protein